MKKWFKKKWEQIKLWRQSLSHKGIDAEADWQVVLGLFVLAALVVTIGHYIYYLEVKDSLDSAQKTITSKRLKTSDIDRAVDLYQDKSNRHRELLESGPRLIDP